MSSRVQDWRGCLLTWAARQQNAPFEWGRTDCGSLARSALASLFGRDVCPDVPFWRSLKQARQVLEEIGGAREVLKVLGAQEMTLAFARAGDILAMPEPEEPVSGTALGVWVDGYAVMSGAGGVMTVPREVLAETKADVVVLYSLWEIPDLGKGPYG